MKYLTTPSNRAKSNSSRPRQRSARLSEAPTAFTDGDHSARSSTICYSHFDTDMESSYIKVSDLLNRTVNPAFAGSKIRRDMFGNLRETPKHMRAKSTENKAFTITEQT